MSATLFTVYIIGGVLWLAVSLYIYVWNANRLTAMMLLSTLVWPVMLVVFIVVMFADAVLTLKEGR